MAPLGSPNARPALFFFRPGDELPSPAYDAAVRWPCQIGAWLATDSRKRCHFRRLSRRCRGPGSGSFTVPWLSCRYRRLVAGVEGVKPKTPVLCGRRHRRGRRLAQYAAFHRCPAVSCVRDANQNAAGVVPVCYRCLLHAAIVIDTNGRSVREERVAYASAVPTDRALHFELGVCEQAWPCVFFF